MTRTKFSRMGLFRGAAVIILVASLGGCLSTSAPPVSVSGVPLLKAYPQEFQDRLAAELADLRACCPAANEFVNDSVKLRRKVKAAHRLDLSDKLKRSNRVLGLFGGKGQ